MTNHFPWPNYYGHFNFFENKIKSHNRVKHLVSYGDGVYQLTRHDNEKIKVFICDCYIYGVAEYLETKQKLGPVHAIVINSLWCTYTYDAKNYCREDKVGLFKFGDFMAALHHKDLWKYLNDDELKSFSNNG